MNLVDLPKTREYLQSLISEIKDTIEYRKSFNQIILKAELGKRGSLEPFPVSMGSFFINADVYEELLRKTKILAGAIIKVRKEYSAGNEEVRKIMRISAEEQELLQEESFDPEVFSAVRFDFFPTEDGVKLCELNSDNPDVILVGDAVAHGLFEKKISSDWKDKIEAPKDNAKIILQSMRESMGPFDTLGVIGPLDRWIIGENHKTISALEKLGVKVIEGNPEDVKYEDGKVFIHGNEIHVARRVAELKYFTKNIASLGGLLTSLKEHKLKLYNQLNDRILGHKSVFAILTDARYEKLFTDEERAVFKEFIPWTRMCEESDLLIKALQDKDELVLKPSGGSEAEGILIGKVTDPEEWETAVRHAFTEQGKWIIQEAIRITPMPVLVDAEGSLRIEEMTSDISVHLFYGKGEAEDGLLFSRYAPGAINNIIAGGGLIFPYVLKG